MTSTKRPSSLTSHDDELEIPIKRLRGGNGPPIEEDYYLEDDDMPEEIEPPEEMESAEAAHSFFPDITNEMRQRWLRPANQVKDNSNDLSLQWFDMDMIGGVPLDKNPNESKDRVVGSTKGQVPIIRAYGVSEAGNSVAVFIHGFTPYGYFALPENATFENTEANLTKIRLLLNQRLDAVSRGPPLEEYCRAVSYVTSHKSIMGYDNPHNHYFKVMVSMPTLVPALKRVMEEGIDLPGVVADSDMYQAFECNVPFVLRYMIDHDISGAGWLTLPKKTYQVRKEAQKKTHSQVCCFKNSACI